MMISGPQHMQMTYAMTETYEELFRTVKNEFFDKTLFRSFPVCGSRYKERIQLSRLTPFEGEEFPKTDEECMRYYESAVRLMVVGEFDVGKSVFYEKTAEEFSGSAGNSICETGIRFRYNIEKDSFPREIRKIIESLKPTARLDGFWYEHILWYNPFVFTQNVTDKIGLSICRKLLLLNMEFYSPTHILFWESGKTFEQDFPGIDKVYGN